IVSCARVTASCSRRDLSLERLRSGKASARNRSRRRPECSAATVAGRIDPVTEELDLSDLPGTAPANDDPRNIPGYRAARTLAIFLGVFIALAFIALILCFFMRLTVRSACSYDDVCPIM